jgi:hypothetical protein
MLRGNMGLHVIEPKKGVFVYVGSIPFDVMDVKKATSDDVRGGRAFYGDDGKLYTRKSPIFKTRKAAVAFAKKKGYKIIPPGKSAKKNPISTESYINELTRISLSSSYSTADRRRAKGMLKALKDIQREAKAQREHFQDYLRLDRLESEAYRIIDRAEYERDLKRKGNPKMAKKRRTAKQKAATRKLVAFNKKRRGKKTTRRKNTHRRKVAKRKVTKRRVVRKRNPKRTTRAKSHLQIVFKCKGNAIYFLTLRAAKLGWTKTKSDAIFFSTKAQARHTAQNVTVPRDWSLAIAPSNLPAAGLVADCKRQIAGK